MSNTQLSVVSQIGEEYTREKVELIKQTVCQGATDVELQLFLYTSRRMGLDPLARQIHAVKRWNSQAGREVMAIQVGIDGYRLIADRTGKLAGISDPEFDVEGAEHPNKATVTVTKIVDGLPRQFTASARWTEYVQMNKAKDGKPAMPNSMWSKMPYGQLGKCAEALALRKGFPAELSGVYTDDEMGQASNVIEASPEANREAVAQPVVQRKSKQVESKTPTDAQLEGAAKQAQRWTESNGHDPAQHINFAQGKLLFAVQKQVEMSEEACKLIVKAIAKTDHRNTIAKDKFEAVLNGIDPDFLHHQPSDRSA